MDIDSLDDSRAAQRKWAQAPLHARVAMIAMARKKMALRAQLLAEAVPQELAGSLHRTVADTLVAEVLPLIEACRYLEKEASAILRTTKLGRKGRPVWLSGVEGEVERVPWGVVLILGAANYPLFLSGVQAIQALVAGNAVMWKPAPGTETAANALRRILIESGLVAELLTVLDSEVESAANAIDAGVDHVLLTGSAETGKKVLRQLAETLTPATMELSGCDAVFVLPGANVERAIRAIGFGLRFNGSATCMAPRRLFLVGLSDSKAQEFESRLCELLVESDSVPLPSRTIALLRELIEDARAQGADILLDGVGGRFDEPAGVTLIANAHPALKAMQMDIFAPILSVMRTADADEALTANAACPYALSASVFGPERSARALAAGLRVGNLVINDLIVPTADPRIPFGGRGQSGFGVTRGREGLLAMTTPRVIQVQASRSTRAYDRAGDGHIAFFAGLASMLHAGSLRDRLAGWKQVLRAGRKLN